MENGGYGSHNTNRRPAKQSPLEPPDQRWNTHSIHVLTLDRDLIAQVTLFIEPRLFDNFGLPRSLARDAVPAHPGHNS